MAPGAGKEAQTTEQSSSRAEQDAASEREWHSVLHGEEVFGATRFVLHSCQSLSVSPLSHASLIGGEDGVALTSRRAESRGGQRAAARWLPLPALPARHHAAPHPLALVFPDRVHDRRSSLIVRVWE